MKRYRLSPEAQGDLADIRQYLLREGGAALARHVRREIRNALRLLAATPGLGHVRADLTEEAVKFWPVFSYLIIYDPLMQPLGVARILHAAQDLETMSAADHHLYNISPRQHWLTPAPAVSG